jgi:hypothetical protein
MRNSLTHSIYSARPSWAALLVALAVSACGGSGGPATPPQGGITVTEGDGQATISWTAAPDVKYWIFYAPTTSIDTRNWINTASAQAILNTTTPYVITGLTNGTTYSFTLNGRTGDGAGGEGTPSVTIVPRLAGATWANVNGNFGGNTIRSIGYGVGGTDSNSQPLYYYLAVGDNGSSWRSSDGITWTAFTAPTTGQLNGVVYGLSKFITIGAGGFIAYTTDLSSTGTWTQASSNTTSSLNALASNGAIVIAVGDNGTILRSDNGASWSQASSTTSQHLYGISYSGSGVWSAVGAQGTLLTSSDSGVTWKAATANTSNDLRSAVAQTSVVTTNGSTSISYSVVAVGDKGTVLRSTDGGSTWATQTSGTTANLLAVSQSSNQTTGSTTNNQWVATGSGGTVIRSTDGMTWTSSTSTTPSNLYALISGYFGKIVAAGQAGVGIYSQ